ncbi:MAG: hypothetical protein ACRD0X_02200, partial [Thermoanaerobaculia bacterium]
MPRSVLAYPPLALLALAFGCAREPAAGPIALRLVDAYQPESVEGRVAETAAPARTERRFDGEPPEGVAEKLAATWGWEAGPGVEGLAVREGRLVGRTTSDFPLLHLDWPEAAGGGDTVHAVEVRLSVTGGEAMAMTARGTEEVDLAKIVSEARDWPWDTTAKLTPGTEMQTVTLKPPRAFGAERHLLLRVTDAPGAEFSIESLRIVFRREHLAAIPSGVSYQGLGQIFRETLVARAPEALRFPLEVPKGAFLDLALGTVEEGPVTFRV